MIASSVSRASAGLRSGRFLAFGQVKRNIGRRGLVRVAQQQVIDPLSAFMAIHWSAPFLHALRSFWKP